MDTLSPEQRSERMSRVKCKDTKPEMVVRRLAHRMGYRYRLHVRSLPGTPDLVFPRLKKAIHVHGCFWHRHKCALGDRMPKSRLSFWTAKLEGNAKRDAANLRALRGQGWSVLIVWECELRDSRLEKRLKKFLSRAG